MQPAFDQTDWSVLSTLLRLAQREGWRVDFAADDILVSRRQAAKGVISLPAVLMRQASSTGWQASIRRGDVTLRHAAVRQAVTLCLGA